MDILNKIQQGLKAPKGQRNTFGNYNYRSCEDILEAVKPLLGEARLTLSDEMVVLGTPLSGKSVTKMKDGAINELDLDIGSRFYVKATATLTCGEETISVSAYARESLNKKGMDASQITGTASSYARKYALNGLFCIDDTKDADSTNKHGKEEKKEEPAESMFTPYAKGSGLTEEEVKVKLKKIGIKTGAQLKESIFEDVIIMLKETKND